MSLPALPTIAEGPFTPQIIDAIQVVTGQTVQLTESDTLGVFARIRIACKNAGAFISLLASGSLREWASEVSRYSFRDSTQFHLDLYMRSFRTAKSILEGLKLIEIETDDQFKASCQVVNKRELTLFTDSPNLEEN